jgi:Flp pilus assembly protein TadD
MLKHTTPWAIRSRPWADIKRRERSCREALRLNPPYPEAHTNLGNALRFLGRVDEAEISVREALRLKPHNPVVYNNLGNVLIHQGKLVEAAGRLWRCLRP